MTYSNNIRKLAIALYNQGHSPEEISTLFSEIILKNNGKILSLAKEFGLIFSEADQQELSNNIPEGKTIRGWMQNQNYNRLVDEGDKDLVKIAEYNAGDICKTSPENMDVVKLSELLIPKKEAPEILREWRSFHRQGEHEYCELFTKLIEDLQIRKIPFKNARGMLQLGIRALRFDMKKEKNDLESARAYRPWESIESHSSFVKESEEIRKPGPLRLTHLNDITQIIYKFQLEIESAIEQEDWLQKFSIENNEIIDNFFEHFPEIQADFTTLMNFREFGNDKNNNPLKKKILGLQRKINKTITLCIKDQNYLKRVCITCIKLDADW
jgi:hypothetical protein